MQAVRSRIYKLAIEVDEGISGDTLLPDAVRDDYEWKNFIRLTERTLHQRWQVSDNFSGRCGRVECATRGRWTRVDAVPWNV
jgi:hypothetical protein